MSYQVSQKVKRPLVAPADEQPYTAAGVAAPIRRVASGRVADAEAARALAKLPRAPRFIPRRITVDPRFRIHQRRRLAWLRSRRNELAQMTGGVSYGVGAMLNAAAWLYAGGEFAAEMAAETADLELFKVAANLTATARTHDMGAWEMAVRESAARPPAPAPWMTDDADDPEETETP